VSRDIFIPFYAKSLARHAMIDKDSSQTLVKSLYPPFSVFSRFLHRATIWQVMIDVFYGIAFHPPLLINVSDFFIYLAAAPYIFGPFETNVKTRLRNVMRTWFIVKYVLLWPSRTTIEAFYNKTSWRKGTATRIWIYPNSFQKKVWQCTLLSNRLYINQIIIILIYSTQNIRQNNLLIESVKRWVTFFISTFNFSLFFSLHFIIDNISEEQLFLPLSINCSLKFLIKSPGNLMS